MRAAVLHARHDLRVEERPVPHPAPEELLVEVRTVGICGTDAHEFAAGPHMFPLEDQHPVTGHVGPMVPGHEFAGTVVEAGRRTEGFAAGDLVSSGAAYSCGDCDKCRRGRTNLCRRYATVGLHRDGALAQYVVVPAAACLAVSSYGLTADAAALGQPMSIAVHAMRRGRLTGSDRALVVGAGGIGAFLTFAASRTTDDVTVTDVAQDRLTLAADLGAAEVVDGSDPAAREDLAGRGDFTVVYEVSGTSAGLATARACAGPGVRIVLVGLQSGEMAWDLRTLSLSEQEVIGTNAHVLAEDLPTALELLAARREPWSDVAPDALSLDEVVADGMAALAEGRTPRIKTLIDPWAEATRPTRMVSTVEEERR